MNPRLRQQAVREWRRCEEAPLKPPQPLATVVEKVVKRLQLQDQVAQGALASQWAAVVGPFWAKNSHPVALRDGVLTIAVKHAAIMAELRSDRMLLDKIRSHFASAKIRQIRFRNLG